MPSASNNQSNTKLVKQTSMNSVNSGGVSGSSCVKSSKKPTENTAKSTNTNATITNETSKENINNVAAVVTQQQNVKNWETSSAAGNTTAAPNNKDAGNDALNPMKLTFTTIEHKIRNLEKRKTKLEGYLSSGKELSSEQRAAVAKYDAVMATLEFARDLVKQMQQFTKDAEKEQKKQARKELIAKAQAETIKIREVLIIQNILSCFTDDAVRNDFQAGENGAAKLETGDIDIIEKFCSDVQTRRPETSEDVSFATSAQKAAEIFSMTIDARPKQYGETTYENVKRIFHHIQESDYLDKIYLTDTPDPEVKITLDDNEQEHVTSSNEEVVVAQVNTQEQDSSTVEDSLESLNIEASSLTQPVHETPVLENATILAQQQQQQQTTIIKEHIDLQQQQATLANLPPQAGQPLMAAPMAPPATAVPSFQPTAPAPPSGATTPVHVALFHPSMHQPTAQQLQQIPNAAALIGSVHTNAAGQILTGLPPQPQAVQNVPPPSSVQANHQQQQEQRQILTSPAGQAGVGTGPIAMHNANLQQQPPPPAHFNPTSVHAVEQNFFKHPQPLPQPQQPQYLQQIRPLAEVIGSGNFYFLQDSELDSPELNNQPIQGVPQSTIIFEQQQQPPPQNLHQNKPTQNIIEQNTSTNNQQQQQVQQINQQHPLTQQPQQQNPAQTPIQTQTFTNQSFPQMPPPPQQQQHPSNASIMQSNTPSPLFQQQQVQRQQQQKATNSNNTQLFSPIPTQNMPTPHHQQQQAQLIMPVPNEVQQQPQQQQPPANLIMMNRLATAAAPQTPLMQHQQQQQGLLQQHQQQINPQNQSFVAAIPQQLPPNVPTGDMSQTPKNTGFAFENPVVSVLSYEQQMQNKLNAEKVLNAFQEVNSVNSTHLHKNDLINEWDEAVLKGTTTSNNQQDFKSSQSVQVVEAPTKWSAEVNANSPITVQQSQPRKNEWTSSAVSGNNNSVGASESSGGYGNDNRPETNHWHSQDSNSYGGRSSTGGHRGQGGGAGGYQRQRNDDRRDDRRPGGGGGGYRGRSNYGSGNPQQNGQSRGGNSSGIYFRNNENSGSNSYYQNGNGAGSSVYSNKDSRYDSRGGGNYRGQRGSDNNSTNPRNNGPPPRHMGNRTSGGGNSNSNSYMNSRQSSNRMPLGIENKN